MSRDRIVPFPLPSVHSRHHHAVFGDLHECVDQRLVQLSGKRDPFSTGLAAFLLHLKDEVSADRFGELQRKWVRPALLGPDESMLKFFDFVFWCEAKFRIANRLKLGEAPRSTIVDIGAGPGHWCFIAKYLNHDTIATDLPSRPDTANLLQMYADFREMLGVAWIAHVTTPQTPLPPVDRPIHFCTSLLAEFHVHEDGRPWSIADWRTFLKNLTPLLSGERREIYLQMNRYCLSDEAWDYLSQIADWSFPGARHVRLSSKLELC